MLLHLENIQLYGYHGCWPHEAEVGQWFYFDIKIEYDFLEAAQSDNLEHSIDYVKVFEIVKNENLQRSNLIENLALRIKLSILDTFPSAKNISVQVKKPNPGGLDKNLITSVLIN